MVVGDRPVDGQTVIVVSEGGEFGVGLFDDELAGDLPGEVLDKGRERSDVRLVGIRPHPLCGLVVRWDI